MTTTSPAEFRPLPIWQVLLCGAAILTLAMGVRHGFGLWLQPITQAQNWTRENFALAIAIQNLIWGFAGIFSGMLADRFGAFRVIVTCTVLYAGIVIELTVAVLVNVSMFVAARVKELAELFLIKCVLL